MVFEELVDAAGRRLGVALAARDGAARLLVDGMAVDVLDVAACGAVALRGAVGAPPPQGLAALHRAMLEANFGFAGTGGATLAVNPESGELTLERAAPLAGLDAEAFLALLERFVNVLEAWRTTVADYRPPAEPPPDAPPADDGYLPV